MMVRPLYGAGCSHDYISAGSGARQVGAVLSGRPDEAPLSSTEKGVPAQGEGVPLPEVASRGWNLLREDLPLPVAVIKADALQHNSRWMKGFLSAAGVRLAPHGKTSMSPALFDLQLDDGAWALTLSTPQQIQTARRFGYQRLFLANQLVGRAAVDYVAAELERDPDFDFYCLVDSTANVAALAAAMAASGAGRSLQVLVELGFTGGRTGCRSLGAALEVARAVRATQGRLSLRGVEGFEGLIRGVDAPDTIRKVDGFLQDLAALAYACEDEGLFAPGEVLFSAGGSAFFDRVSQVLGVIDIGRPSFVLLRSGCYITHDQLMYTRLFAQMAERGAAGLPDGGLLPALEVWAYVQSTPEPGKVIVAMGKRDVSYDEPPVALHWSRPGRTPALAAAPPGCRVTHLNDQHCHMSVEPDCGLQVGDLLGFGVSHPCLTFDKWRVLHLVDAEYTVTGSVRTYF